MKFRFTTRDLGWLVLVVAMACGWWGTYRDVCRDYNREYNSLRADFILARTKVLLSVPRGDPILNTLPPVPPEKKPD
jgi:hypothetical protein